jgi:hypothetical protein
VRRRKEETVNISVPDYIRFVQVSSLNNLEIDEKIKVLNLIANEIKESNYPI